METILYFWKNDRQIEAYLTSLKLNECIDKSPIDLIIEKLSLKMPNHKVASYHWRRVNDTGQLTGDGSLINEIKVEFIIKPQDEDNIK